MEFDGTNVSTNSDPASNRGLIVRIKQLIEAAVVGVQDVAAGVEDHGTGVGMGRGTVCAVAHHTLPRVTGQLGRIAAEDIRVESSAAIRIGKRPVLSVACYEH